MKKIACLILTLVALCCSLSLIACSKSDPVIYTVTLKSEISPYKFDGKITGHDFLEYDGVWGTLEIEQGGIVGNIDVNSENAEKGGYKFCGWFTDSSYTVQWNTLLDPVKGNITLYAKWEKI